MMSNFDPVGETIQRCPFLNALLLTEGESFARQVATDFSKTEARTKTPTRFEELQGVAKSYTFAHSDQGLLPLKPALTEPAKIKSCSQSAKISPVLRAVPTASISLSGFWSDFNPFRFNNNNNDNKPQQKRPSKKNNFSSSESQGRTNSSLNAMPEAASGQCPLRKYLGPFATAFMGQSYRCPKPIVMMRAAIAKSPVVRALRPESLEIKLLAVALASSILNVPFGMLREHTRKFSPQWFLVVHATIPFIAMLRKAVVMPPYAILFTVAAAIGGQAVGAKAEKRRMQWMQTRPSNKADNSLLIEDHQLTELDLEAHTIVM